MILHYFVEGENERKLIETIKNNFPAELRSSETADLFMEICFHDKKTLTKKACIHCDK